MTTCEYTVSVNLYSLDELDEGARWNAIEEHRRFMLEEMHPDDFISGDPEYDTPEKLMETYNAEFEYYENNDDPIIESIECNEYLFYEDGTLAHIIYKFPDREHREMYLKHYGKEILIKREEFKTFAA